MKAVVLAGGKGTRLAPYTKILPKPLMPIGETPILEVILRQMKMAGIDHVTLTVGHLSTLLRTFFQDGQQWGLHIEYSYEDSPLGTAGPIALINDLNDTFLVTNGDVLTTLRFADVLRFHREQGATATIAVHQRKVKIDLGVIQWNSKPEINGYIEKAHLRLLRQHGGLRLRAARAELHPQRPISRLSRPGQNSHRRRREGSWLRIWRLLARPGPPR